MAKKLTDPRAAAARCLQAVQAGASLNQQLALFEPALKERDCALYRQLCYGSLRLYPRLAGLLKPLLKKPLKTKDDDISMLMLIGLYQLLELRVPDHAAVGATVAATANLGKPWAKGLVNGVLRNAQRRIESLEEGLSAAEKAAQPPWLFDAITKAWPEQAEQLFAANRSHPPLCLRVNQSVNDREHYRLQLEARDLSAELCEWAEQGLRLHNPVDVSNLPGFNEGVVSVQDEAPQLSAALLDIKPGQRVLDACCAPGGKTCHIAELEPQLADLLALDIDEQRLQRVAENLQRLGLQATLRCADAAAIDQWWDGQYFDRILLDAPCSATGVIRRNPDILLHRRPEDIVALHDLQLNMLQSLWQTLAPGGRLLYATCSILPTENVDVVAAFLSQQNDAVEQLIQAEWGIPQTYGRQLLTREMEHDGFYYALLEKSQ